MVWAWENWSRLRTTDNSARCLCWSTRRFNFDTTAERTWFFSRMSGLCE